MPYYLSPVGNESQTATSGSPLSGGFIYTYAAGSATPVATYTDNTGGTPQANPIVLNTYGLPPSPIWILGGQAMKFQVKDASGNLIRTLDYIAGVNDPTFAATATYLTGVGGTNTITASLGGFAAYAAGQVYNFVPANSSTGAVTININGVGAKSITKSGTTALTGGELVANAVATVIYDGAQFQLINPQVIALVNGGTGSATAIGARNNLSVLPPVRQTVLSGPVDSNGLSSFGGATGATTVTASGTLVATAAQGTSDYWGSITNPSWTGLSTNGTMYLYLDIASTGVCTTGSTTLAPVYQWGGTYSTTNLQNTFNIQEMTMKVGNGASASQVWRVFVGEVTVAGAVVTAITWYALMGRALVTQASLAVSTAYTLTHNVGTSTVNVTAWLENKTTDAGWAVGDRLHIQSAQDGDGTGGYGGITFGWSAKTLSAVYGAFSGKIPGKSAGAQFNITPANWSFGALVTRGW